MRWVYILRCQNDIIYVGETARLLRRLKEHCEGNGSYTTKDFLPYELMGIYKLPLNEDKNGALELENEITLMYMKSMNTKWDNVYGGKYHKGFRPIENPSTHMKLTRPYCKCKIPADINVYKDKKYWRCCRKNIWEGLQNELEIPKSEPCNFYQQYIENQAYQCENYIYGDPKTKQSFKDLIQISPWLENIPREEEDEAGSCVNCDTYVWCDRNGNYKPNGIIYPFTHDEEINIDNRRLICKNCFVNYNDILSKKYSFIDNLIGV